MLNEARREDGGRNREQPHGIASHLTRKPPNSRPNPGTRVSDQGSTGTLGGVGAQAVSPESRINLSRRVNSVKRDLASLIRVEGKMEELVQMYGR